MPQSEDGFSVEVVRLPEALLVTVSGDLDADTAGELTRTLDRVDSGVVVLDLRAVPFCDSVGLASIVTLVGRGADLRVIGSRQVIRLMTLTGMENHVAFAASVAEATSPDVRDG
jgi:anti-sigma B factor antagonist